MYVNHNAGKKDASVVYVLSWVGGGKAVVLNEAGEFLEVDVSTLSVEDANKVTPFASWPAAPDA